MVFFPLAVFQTGDVYYKLDVFGLTNLLQADEYYPAWWMFVLTATIALLAAVTIFLFKKRVLQVRICIFNAILMVCYYGLFAFTVYLFRQSMSDASFSVKVALSFPLICLILDYLAIRNIGADEVLVRSLDRLR
jgi:uncharacterized membrane protein